MGILDGKVAICTGSGRGVGKEVAKLMAKHGAKVILNDPGVGGDGRGHDNGPAAEAVAEIKAEGGQAAPNFDSVATYEGATKMVKQALDTFGGLHILFNPAGILRDTMFHKMSPEDWKAVLDVHLTGHFNMCRAVINHFRDQNYGRIITVSSTSGLLGNIGQANYAAAKLGIVGLTRILAMESASKGITVNAIAPSANTRMTQSVPTPKDPKAAEQRRIRLERSRPDAIAPLCVFLASELAKDVTGQVFHQRAGEITLYGQPRPRRSLHRTGGWTPELIADVAMPALKNEFASLAQSGVQHAGLPMD